MLAAATTAKPLAEIALLALAGAADDSNPFYRVLQLAGRPWAKGARWLSPAAVMVRPLPLVAFWVLLLVWAVAAVGKVRICLESGVVLCKQG